MTLSWRYYIDALSAHVQRVYSTGKGGIGAVNVNMLLSKATRVSESNAGYPFHADASAFHGMGQPRKTLERSSS